MFFAPVVLGAAAAVALGPHFGVAVALAAVLFIYATGWLGVLAIAGMQTSRWLERFALAISVPVCSAVLFAAGGLGSPAALLLLALPAEAFWVARSRIALVAGCIAMALAAALAVVAGLALPPMSPASSIWHWLPVLAYGAAFLPRAAALRSQPENLADIVPPLESADLCGGMMLEFGRGSDVAAVRGACEDVPGLTGELLDGQGLFERIHVADRVSYMCALSKVRESGRAAAALRLRVPAVDAEDGPDEYRPVALDLWAAPEDGRIVAVLRDKFEVETLRRQMLAAKDEAAMLEIAKGRFLASVSHELRTPLNAIIGFSDILLTKELGGCTDLRQREYADLIKEAGYHLLGIVNSILDVSKIEAGTYALQAESFVFAEAVDMCRAMVALQAERKGIELRTEISRTIGEIVADRRAVQQILINLVANAVKFTRENGQVTIGARRVGSRLHFWVEDNGIGMSEDDLSRIGKPFMQVRNDYTRQFDGTGLGLSLVKGLVALHDGTMSIESAPGEGTKVGISVPVDGPHRISSDFTEVAATHEEDHGTLRKTA